ncbi:NPAS4 protein, partial [Nothocercus nigrocapillus]|nr:NPAS4 protein [Nothocercus nigrocapillus]
LGFGAPELRGRSWYGLLHPDDLQHVATQHLRLGESPCPQGPGVPHPNVPKILVAPHSPRPWGPPSQCPQDPGVPPSPKALGEAEAWCLRQQLEAEAPPASAPLGPPEPPLVPGLDFSGLDFPNGRAGADNLSVGANVGVNVGVNVGPNVGVNVGVNIGPTNVGVNIAPNIGA